MTTRYTAYQLAKTVLNRKEKQHIHLSKDETELLADAVIDYAERGIQPSIIGNDDPHDVISGQPRSSKANERQVAGNHYGLTDLQHWDLVDIFNWDYFQGQITKYVMRWKNKNGVQDLEKAAHFLEKYIELAKKKVGK